MSTPWGKLNDAWTEFWGRFGGDPNNLAVFGNTMLSDNDSSPLTLDKWYWKTKEKEDAYDALTLMICNGMRSEGEVIEDWLKDAELDAWDRIERRAV